MNKLHLKFYIFILDIDIAFLNFILNSLDFMGYEERLITDKVFYKMNYLIEVTTDVAWEIGEEYSFKRVNKAIDRL